MDVEGAGLGNAALSGGIDAALFHRSPVPMAIHGSNGELLAANEAFEAIVGDVVGAGAESGEAGLAFLHSDEREEIEGEIRDLLARGGGTDFRRSLLVGALGEERVVEASVSVAKNDAGDNFLYVVLRDATREEWNSPSGRRDRRSP